MLQELFLENHGGLFQVIILQREQIMCEQDILKNLKNDLQNNMLAAGLVHIANDNYEMMFVGETLAAGINEQQLGKNGPEFFDRLPGNYLTGTPSKSYVKVERLA